MKKIFLGIIILALAVGIFVLAKSHSKQKPIATAVFVCDNNMTISAAFYKGKNEIPVPPGQMPQPTGSVEISLNGTATTTLKQTISADGSRYASSDERLVFWNKGDQALIMRNNSMDLSYRNCTAR